MKKKDLLASYIEQGISSLDKEWTTLFLETEVLDQLLYYLDLSLLSHRAKLKTLRSLKSEVLSEIMPHSLCVIEKDAWFKSNPYDQFLKSGSLIWVEDAIILKHPVPAFILDPHDLEAILPWVTFKLENVEIKAKIPATNFFKPNKGMPFHHYLSQSIFVLAVFIAVNFFVQSNSIKLANSGLSISDYQKQGIYFLLAIGTGIILFFPFQCFSWSNVSNLIPGFMKNFKLERFRRGRRTKVRFNSLITLLDLVSPEKSIIPLTAIMSLLVSISFLYDNIIGIVTILIFIGIYYLQHLTLESRAKAQLANSISAQSFFLDSYRSLPSYSATAKKNGFLEPLKDYWQSLSESYASILYDKDRSALWYQTRLALIKTVLVQLVFLVMVLVLGLNYFDYVSFSAIQIALTVITGPTHDLFKRLKNYTHFSVLSSMFTTNEHVDLVDKVEKITCSGLHLFGSNSSEINFSFNCAQIYSVVGKSGSGKTELARILTSMCTFGLGSLNINGKHVSPGECWRIKSIFISDELHWRGGRIIDYLTARDKSPNHSKLRDITKSLGLDHKIMLLSNGYETYVGEINLPFSHAEKMFLSLTRAIYADYDAVVLDNVLSRADKSFQNKVFEFLKNNLKGRFVFIIDNNFDIISKSDYAIIMDNGAICDHGPPEELIIVSDRLKRISRPTNYFLP